MDCPLYENNWRFDYRYLNRLFRNYPICWWKWCRIHHFSFLPVFFFLSRKKKVSIENCLLFHGFILQELRTTQIISDKILVRFLGFLNQVFWGSVSLGLHQNCQQTQPIVFYRWAENAQSQCLQTENGMEKIHSDLLVSCWCADVSGTVETMLQS